MATVKEKALVAEITGLALEMGAGEYNACVDYHGYIHGVDVRVAHKDSSEWAFYSDTVYLSGRNNLWTEKTSIPQLKKILAQVKKYHPQFDADGVKL